MKINLSMFLPKLNPKRSLMIKLEVEHKLSNKSLLKKILAKLKD
jgi:hypothetical protein